MSGKTILAVAALFAVTAIIITALLIYFSPYQSCLRVVAKSPEGYTPIFCVAQNKE